MTGWHPTTQRPRPSSRESILTEHCFLRVQTVDSPLQGKMNDFILNQQNEEDSCHDVQPTALSASLDEAQKCA